MVDFSCLLGKNTIIKKFWKTNFTSFPRFPSFVPGHSKKRLWIRLWIRIFTIDVNHLREGGGPSKVDALIKIQETQSKKLTGGGLKMTQNWLTSIVNDFWHRKYFFGRIRSFSWYKLLYHIYTLTATLIFTDFSFKMF